MPKVSEEHREQVRRRLLDAARAVVLRDGPEGATTRAILAEAGMATGSLYTYFSSKEELFEALAEQVIGENVVLFSATGRADETPAGLALRLVGDLLTRPDDSAALTYFRGRMTADPDVREAVRRFNRYMVRTFSPLTRAAQAQGAIRPELDPDAVTELFDVLIDGLNRRHVTGDFVTSFEQVGRAAFVILLGGAMTDTTEETPP